MWFNVIESVSPSLSSNNILKIESVSPSSSSNNILKRF